MGDLLGAVQVQHRYRRLPQERCIGRHRDDITVVDIERRVTQGRTVYLDLGKGYMLKSLPQDQV
jgi:hypothetical protein